MNDNHIQQQFELFLKAIGEEHASVDEVSLAAAEAELARLGIDTRPIEMHLKTLIEATLSGQMTDQAWAQLQAGIKQDTQQPTHEDPVGNDPTKTILNLDKARQWFEKIWFATDDEPAGGECAPVALYAGGGGVNHEGGKQESFCLGNICVDGVERRIITDGDHVAILLGPNESHSGLWIDDLRLEIEISPSGKLAILLNYTRDQADFLLLEAGEAPAKHSLRWELGTEKGTQ